MTVLISPSQLSTPCKLNLKYYRMRRAHEHGEHEGQPIPGCPLCEGWEVPEHRIALEFGTAVHEGIEAYLRGKLPAEDRAVLEGEEELPVAHDAEQAIDVSHRHIRRCAKEGMTYDDPPRVRRDGFLYKGDEGRMPTEQHAAGISASMVRSWIERFGAGITPRDVEIKVYVPLEPYGIEDAQLITKLDLTTTEGGIIDFKTSRAEWDAVKWDDKLDQMLLYGLGYKCLYGEGLPEYGLFHVAPKEGDFKTWQVIDVALDESRIEQVIEYVLKPAIRMIRADAFIPNRDGRFPHSEKYCDFWSHCPFGAKAQGEAATVLSGGVEVAVGA